MPLSSVVLAGLLAMGPQWAIIDLPYPEVTEMQSAGGAPSAEAAVAGAALEYARARQPGTRKPEVSQVRIEGSRASAVLSFGNRTESVSLALLNGEWRVVPPNR
jgi:hypothetical protein